MSVATSLIGRPASWHDKAANNGKGETYIGVICAVYGQVDARIAPRIAIETKSGQMKSAPLEDIWLLELANGDMSDLGASMLAGLDKPEVTPDGGTGKTPG